MTCDAPMPGDGTVAAFRDALRKGLGRAEILLRIAPSHPGLHAELLHACCNNLVYDVQSEERRAPYLSRMIGITSRLAWFHTELESWLQATRQGEAAENLRQAFDILVIIGGQEGIAFLRRFVLETGEPDLAVDLTPQLIRLLGIEAMVPAARRFSARRAEEWWLIENMTLALRSRDGAEAAAASLAQARRNDPAFERVMAEEEQRIAGLGDWRPSPAPQPEDMTADELCQAAADVLAEDSVSLLLARLRVFQARDLPGDPVRFVPLLRHADRRVVVFAANALSRLDHLTIRELAHGFIAKGDLALGAKLLRRSHRAGDLAVIRTLLERSIGDEDLYHSLACSALEALTATPESSEAQVPILLHIYENGPCSHCRAEAVEGLAGLESVPGWLAKEGRFDAVPGIAHRCEQESVRRQGPMLG